MKKIFTILMVLLLYSAVVFAAGPSIERIWMEEDKTGSGSTSQKMDANGNVIETIKNKQYNFWIEVRNENGEIPGSDEVLVNVEEKNNQDIWIQSGRIAQYCYQETNGNQDCSKKYYKFGSSYPTSMIESEGVKYEVRIKAYQEPNTVTKDASFIIGNYNPEKPDLVIKNIEVTSLLTEDLSGFQVPALKFIITLKNDGKKDAIIRDSAGTASLFLKVNGNDFGWNPILLPGAAKSKETFKSGESMEMELKYWEQNQFSNLKIGENIFSFYVDNGAGDYSSSYKGKILESDESNNKYEFTYTAQPCTDTEVGSSEKTRGEVKLFGIEQKDDCKWNQVIEYWCERDFHVGYGYRSCSGECIDGGCGYGPKCFDLDDKKLDIKGSVSGYATDKQDSQYMYSDECLSDSTLKEYFCDGVQYSNLEKECPYGCSNGACKNFYDENEEIIVDDEKTESTEGCPEKSCQIDSEKCIGGNKIITEKCTVYIKKENNCEQYSTTQTKNLKDNCKEKEEKISCETGCLINKDSCIPISTRIEKTGEGYYCNYDNIVHKQKDDSSACQNSYECKSNSCMGSICVSICNGCFDEKFNCLPFGTRTDIQYCGLDKKMNDLKVEDISCNNNFECTTNVCVNSKCISPNLIQKIILWLQNLFG